MLKKLSPQRWGRAALPVVFAASLVACGSMPYQFASLPAPAELAALPVIQLGQPKPAQGEYIVYLPANQPVSTVAKVQGSLFAQTDSKTLSVQLKRDIYLYKNWISYDKRAWLKSTDAVQGNFHIQLPDYDHPQAGEVLIELDAKS